VSTPRPLPAPGWRWLLVLAGVVFVSAVLYLARPVLLPVALAILLAFILSPVVAAIERRGVRRTISVALVVLMASAVLGAAGWVLSQQAAGFMAELPRYEFAVKEKVTRLRAAVRGGVVERVRSSLNEVVEEIQKESPAPQERDKPVPVVVRGVEPSVGERLGRWMEPLAKVGLVAILVVFMLAERRELRNRFLRVFGPARLAAATKAIDEATDRITGYLLAQSFVNLCTALGFAAGLWLIGVPYALLWGVLLGLLRYVPYVGVWIALAFPLVMSIAVFEGWREPLLVLAVFAVLETAVGGFLEPVVYSQRAGVSKVALLIAIAFWTWIWGPAGLILAMPITVCLVVVAKYVPGLEFVVMMLGDDPALQAPLSYYQRLLAADPVEAAEIVARRRAQPDPERVYDEVFVPALVEARADRRAGRIDEADEQFVHDATRDLLAGLGAAAAVAEVPAARTRVAGCPARGAADEAALVMLGQLLDPSRFELVIASSELLSGEMIDAIGGEPPAVVCVASLPPAPVAQARYLCKRLRARFPDVRIVVGRFGAAGAAADREALLAAGADRVCTSLLEARGLIVELAALRAYPSAATSAA
jgi:predicted PurR-regulated permease PerM